MMEAHVQSLATTPAERIIHLAEQYPRCALYIKELELQLEGKPFAAELIEYLIKEFISSNDPCAEEIIRSVELLKDKDSREVVHSIKKFARAIYNNKINVFISYKPKDEAVATAVVKAMRGASSKLNITYASEFSSNKDYREKSLRATRNAHWFILLLPDPAEDWDWCLYESGLFRAKKLPGDRLICIHHEGSKIPNQISNVEAVPATRTRLIPFLKKLFCEPNPLPGMDAINKDTMVEPIAEIISSQVSPPTILDNGSYDDISPDTIPQGIAILAAALKFALRFRWEILENKQYHKDVMDTKTAVELRSSIDRIMFEGESAGSQSQALLKTQFDDDTSKDTIDSIYQQWHQLTNIEGSGRLDMALHDRNGTLIHKVMQEFLPINKLFLKMVSQRFSEVLA